jgi:G patch domain/KOW motif-containing protein
LQDDKERYLIDVSLRPDETSLDAYDEMPISDFGKAALLGMGWKDGEAIGGTNKGLAEPIVGVPRLRGLGLGATRDTELQPGHRKIKKYVKPGELRNPNQKQMQVAPGADGKVRHTRGLDEKLVEKEIPTMKENAFVLVGSGPHSGVCAKVKKIWSDRIEVELASGSRISTREEDVRLLTNAEYKALKKQQPKRTADEANGGGSSTNGSRKKRREEPSWLEQNIRVRVISDRYRGGKFYNKKVRVVDVTKPTECNCVDEDQSGLLLEGLRQSELETVIPKKVGGTVMIVLGRCKGSRGKLLEKDKRKSTVVVQLMGESEVDSFRYDQVSEYIGEDMDGDW